MFAFKFLMLCGLICVSMSSESSEEVERILENPKLAPFLKQQVKKYYENNKLKAISDIFESVLGQLPNLTFVAWQNVYDTKGNVVEIRTIELFFPGIGNSSDLLNNDEDDDDEGLEEIQNKYFPLMSKAGIRLEAGNEEYDKEGTLESFSYIDSFNTYAFTDGIYLVNKTIEVDNKSEIDQKIEEFRKGPNPVTVLTFDKENKFIPAESVVVPTYLAAASSLSKRSKDDDSSEESSKVPIPEALVEFVKLVEKCNLNVSIIGSGKTYAPSGWTKADTSVVFNMPQNTDAVTEPTLNAEKMKKYLTKIEELSPNVGAKTRVVKIKDGHSQEVEAKEYNKKHTISSPNYRLLTNYQNGVQGYNVPENKTNAVLHNYIITNPSDPVRNVQVVTSDVVIEDRSKSDTFPPKTLEEIEKMLSQLVFSIDDSSLFAKLLVQELDKKFPEQNHQALIGVDTFNLGAKPYAHLKLAETSVVVFIK
ncbi:uncharacterized protein LOC115879275 [Sitophilus oryzae]|uniref:Uncharacterized protein LOC115879275 n=1 Tax=Sitophilus oryzae TaxID=7048 RepID=A0A6J2XKN3_SITOR|nr:uncharacterized protein LOC115879275 [Sitophilus oryzae]